VDRNLSKPVKKVQIYCLKSSMIISIWFTLVVFDCVILKYYPLMFLTGFINMVNSWKCWCFLVRCLYLQFYLQEKQLKCY